jgi:hypothetical protein
MPIQDHNQKLSALTSENVDDEVSPSCFKKLEDDKEEAVHNNFDFVPVESQLLKE